MPNLPQTMTCIAIREPGPPDVLTARDAAFAAARVRAKSSSRSPPPASTGRMSRNARAAIRRRPALPICRASRSRAALPHSAQARRAFSLGDKVCSLVHGGGYAEYCTVHETIAQPIPGALSFVEAAAIPETFFTVWSNVFERGGLKAGETLLVHGGSSGIGTTAIMLAKAFGATVIVTAGSAEKCAFCRSLGADVAIDYKTEDFVEAVKAATDGRGADVILDMVGGPYVGNELSRGRDGRTDRPDRHRCSATRSTLDLRPITAKRLVHTGSTLRPRTVEEKAAISRALAEKVWPLLAAGRCTPVIDSTFPLREAARAHARMETSEHIGKIVLTI